MFAKYLLPFSTPMAQIYSRVKVSLTISLIALCGISACSHAIGRSSAASSKPRPLLDLMSLTWEKNAEFEQNFLKSFSERNGTEFQFVPNLETVDSRLTLYRQLFRAHSSQPDLLQIDVVWPAMLANDLVDLRPYLKGNEKSFAPQLLNIYVVQGKLVALPTYADFAVLFYRPELLQRYGYRNPPATWDQLEQMAQRIQAGERRAGNKDFWGYTWQGNSSEALTCNALEWQASAGAGIFIEPSGTVHVRSSRFATALRRATNWIGTISPPGESIYREPDSLNLWNAGQVAFMRNWTSLYGSLPELTGKDRLPFALAPMPGGPGGQRGTLGSIGMSVSRYAANRELAIKALLEITDERHDLERLFVTNGIPTHTAIRERPDVKSRTSLLAISDRLMKGVVSRPSLITAEKYDQVSGQYASAVNSVLRRKAEPEQAMADLEKKLMQITGLPAQRD